MNSKDILAKLLAEEDLVIVRKATNTASFDIENRVLVLPVWENMGPDVEDMMIAHEIAHAKWTDLSMLFHNGKFVSPSRKTVINILEDNRIERLIKNLYPVYKSIFYTGYKELLEKKFFGSSKLFMDKVNRLSKLGTLSDVEFIGKQLDLFERINSTKTCQDVLDLVDEVIAMEKAEQSTNPPPKLTFPILGDDLPMDEIEEVDGNETGDSEISEDEESEDCSTADSVITDEELDELVEAESEYNEFNKILASTASARVYGNFKSTEYVNTFGKDVLNIEDILNKLQISSAYSKSQFDEFLSANNKLADIMFKEFEMRKTASRHARIKTHKTGELNISKLHNYKISDNLFRSIQICEDDKNHGMVVLVDWSSSMQNIIEQVIAQIISLSTFCRKAKIPFKVYAFSNGWHVRDENAPSPKHDKLTIGVKLIKFFDEKQTLEVFNEVCAALYHKAYANNKALHLSSTPLNYALYLMNDVMYKFKKDYNLDKTSMILLSDGDDTEEFADSNIRDSVTGKYFILDKNNKSKNRNSLLEVIKHRNKCDIIIFYITNRLSSGIFTKNSHVDHRNERNQILPTEIETTKFDNESILEYSMPNVDKFYIVSNDALVIKTQSINDITPNMTINKMTQIMSKSGLSKESVVIMKKLINVIA